MILNKLKKYIKIPYVKILQYRLTKLYNKKYETKTILNNEYKLIRGTVRSKSDYDEGWILFLSSKANIVFDVGCNIGFSSLLISQFKSIKNIVAIEPNPLSLSIAAENLILNNKSSNVKFIPKAAHSKSKETLKLWTMPGAFAAASTDINFSESGGIANNYINVETITLDDIFINYNLFPDLIKIDVEGAEHFVLEGAKVIAKKMKTKFIVEVHSSKQLGIVQNTEKILLWCDQNNYKSFYLCEHKELNDPQYIKHRGRYHLLLIPNNNKYPKGLADIAQSTDIEEINVI